MNVENLLSKWMGGGGAKASPDGNVTITASQASLARKLRLAYDWIASKAILTSQHDILSNAPKLAGRGGVRVELNEAPAFSSFILLPLLNLAISRRMVFVGAPGRGKTSVATLMSLLTGRALADTRREIQHGHPQMTIHDLLGSPLPSNLMKADAAHEVRLEWRGWLTSRVKIIDEYNRIPTKTQSALLSLLADGYAEMFEQTIETGGSSWYLTANDELGGGTFPVIEALKDRIDVVVRCAPFQMEHLNVLAERIASSDAPEAHIPADIVFSPEELDRLAEEIRAVTVSAELMELIAFVLGQFEFCRRASDRIDYMNKDTLHLAGRRTGHVCNEDCPLDRNSHLCAQVENGVSPRSLQALIHFAKALAYFLGRDAVELNDVRQMLPWVLFEKLRPNLQSPFFEKDEHRVHLVDRATWIQSLFDLGLQQFAAYGDIRKQVAETIAEAADSAAPIARRAAAVERRLARLADDCELNAAVHADIVRLRGIYAGLCKLPGAAR
jgi:MoxR-like ATPase